MPSFTLIHLIQLLCLSASLSKSFRNCHKWICCLCLVFGSEFSVLKKRKSNGYYKETLISNNFCPIIVGKFPYTFNTLNLISTMGQISYKQILSCYYRWSSFTFQMISIPLFYLGYQTKFLYIFKDA